MTKKILVSLIAVMMLFGFVACDNQVQTFRFADTISLVQSSEILEGTTPSAEDFTVTISYTDGTSQSVPGTGYVKFNNGQATAETKSAYGIITSSPVDIETTALSEVQFNGVESVTVVKGTSISSMSDVKITGENVTTTFVFGNSSATLPLTETVFTLFDENDDVVTTAGEVGDVYDVYMTGRYVVGANDEVAIVGRIPTNLQVEVVAKSEVTSISASAVDTIWYGDTATDPANYKVVDQDGNPVTGINIYAVSGVDADKKFNTTSATTVYFALAADPSVTCTLSVTPEDYVTEIRVADPNRDPVTTIQHDGAVAPTLGVSSGVANHLEVKMASDANTWVANGTTDYYFSVPVLNAYSTTAPTQPVYVYFDNEQGGRIQTQVTYRLNAVEG